MFSVRGVCGTGTACRGMSANLQLGATSPSFPVVVRAFFFNVGTLEIEVTLGGFTKTTLHLLCEICH